MRTCGLIRQKMINGKTSYIIEQIKWNGFLSQYEVYDVEICTSKFTIVTDNIRKRKDITFIRIGTKSSSSYTKPNTQYNNQVLPPLKNMRILSKVFLNSITKDVIETITWSKTERVSIPVIYKSTPSIISKSISTSTSSSTSTSHDNPPILKSLYPILNSLNVDTSDLENKYLDVIYLKNSLSEVSCVSIDNNVSLNLEKWGGRGNKELIQIPSVGHLKYDRFKPNVKQGNFIEQTLKALSCNSDNNYHPSSTINLCRYLADNCEDEFTTATGNSGLSFSGQMSAVETVSMMSDVGLNISQFRILLRILRNKLGAKMFEPENIMKNFSGDMILPKFGEYKYYTESGTKPEHILFWIRDSKETQLVIESGDIDLSDIDRIDIVVGGDHGQGAFHFQ